ncbi:MAG: nuclease family protein [Marmoricola sp.]|nr:nuclease family protein [Marmoricola sp.]
MKRRNAAQRHGDFCMTRNRDRYDGRPIYIYAYTDADDQILYVGRTADPRTRMGDHRVNASWWSADLQFSLIEIVEGWPAAVEAEAQAIKELHPVHNIQHNRSVA